jgi:hypothetical protein
MHHFTINEDVFKYKLSREELAKISVPLGKSKYSSSTSKKTSVKSMYKNRAKLVGCPTCGKQMRSDKLK